MLFLKATATLELGKNMLEKVGKVMLGKLCLEIRLFPKLKKINEGTMNNISLLESIKTRCCLIKWSKIFSGGI